jgi:hypothetical protein
MLIATSLATVLFAAAVSASAGADASPVATSVPPMVITLAIAPGVSASLVTRVLAETDAIWRAGGFSFVWQRAVPLTAASRLDQPEPYRPSTLRVVIGEDRGIARDHRTPLGWIVFDGEHEPQREIYLSHANAKGLMEGARGVIGLIDQMPPVQREILLARAMGRALAHELGHFLLASKVHTPRGLLKAGRTAAELFSNARSGFTIDASQRQQIATRLRGDSVVVSR